VTLAHGSESVVLRVIDDGRGMAAYISPDGQGGLRGMRERALLVGGSLAVKSGPSGGVEVRLEVPVRGL
jgi:two-component system sensor histidine kinase UhpB